MRLALLFELAFAERFLPKFAFSGTIWPQPQQIKTSDAFFAVSATVDLVYASDSARCRVVDDAIDRYGTLIRKRAGLSREQHKLEWSSSINQVIITVAKCEEYPADGMLEAYTLATTDAASVAIYGEAEWGVLHALESLAQMIHEIDGRRGVNQTTIADFPRFGFRGMLIDTSRHFLPVNSIKAMIAALSWNKMNVLHWHIVDLESFPYESAVLPRLAELGAYTKFNHVYSQATITELIEYARFRGVRIIPEFDTPGHAESWGPGAGEGFLTQCCDKKGAPDGTVGPIDPSRKANYDLMKTLFGEIKSVFKDDFIHLGGDEVPFGCWQSNPNITKWMKEKNLTSYADVESVWIDGMIDIVEKLKYNYVVWEEVFSNGVEINPATIVEVWKDYTNIHYNDTIAAVTKAGYRAILAAPWYLNRVTYGVDWDKAYLIEPTNFNGTDEQKKLVVGGSAAIWGEYVDGTNVLSRTWPRASAVAERLWSDKSVRSTVTALPRLNEWRCQMTSRGLPAEPNLSNINREGYHQFGYCPEPYDPFNVDFFW